MGLKINWYSWLLLLAACSTALALASIIHESSVLNAADGESCSNLYEWRAIGHRYQHCASQPYPSRGPARWTYVPEHAHVRLMKPDEKVTTRMGEVLVECGADVFDGVHLKAGQSTYFQEFSGDTNTTDYQGRIYFICGVYKPYGRWL